MFCSFYYFSLGPLVGKVKEYQVESIVDTLCNNMLSEKEQLRDISRFVVHIQFLFCAFLVSNFNFKHLSFDLPTFILALV